MLAGYSGTPLIKKLGLKPPMQVLTSGAPEEYPEWLGELPGGVVLTASAVAPVEAAHLFVTERAALEAQLESLRRTLDQAGFIWVSWPKKSSRVPTNITEDTIRQVALPMGYVDVKVCAVSDTWSGLKLVIRKSERIQTIPPPKAAP
jgi:hypothetical protein